MDKTFIEQNNAKQWLHPMANHAALADQPPMVVCEGEGVYITDMDGHKMVDGIGGLWNVNVGYSRPEIKQAIMAQLEALPYYSGFNGTTHPAGIELSHKLIEMLEPEGMARVFFSSGGSDAVESALRLARQYWKAEGYKDRYKFISLMQGYHGTHFGAASVNGNNAYRRNYEPQLPGCFHVETPWTYRNPFTDDPHKLAEICAELLDRTIRFQGPETVAAFIAEPVQGAGGVIVPPENYWPLIREVCDEHGVLLIADEVITGFGRTGSLFGVRGWGVKPDMMTFAKGINSGYIPLGATAINERMAQTFMQPDNPFNTVMHGYTYSGHPVACAASIATLEIVLNENLPTHAGKMGDYLMDRMAPFMERFNTVGDVRGKGLMMAVELVEDKQSKTPMDVSYTRQIMEIARHEGAVVRGIGNKLVMSPPLIINEAEIDIIVNALDVALSELDR